MCILFFTINDNKRYKFILASNRDEHFERPTVPAHYWKEGDVEILSPKDKRKGGTWLGVSKSGRFGILTNYRTPNSTYNNINSTAPSRGKLITEFLISNDTVTEYINQLKTNKDIYEGFNLLIGDLTLGILGYFTNKRDGIEILQPGIYGLSNKFLDTPWFKLTHGKNKFSSIIDHSEEMSEEDLVNKLFSVLSDKLLPEHFESTGALPDWEPVLAPIFVQSFDKQYGTRTQTVILVDNNNKLTFYEKTLQLHQLPKIIWENQYFTFTLPSNITTISHSTSKSSPKLLSKL